jgi:hypothetical protein
MPYSPLTPLPRLDINRLHRTGALKEGAVTRVIRGWAPSPAEVLVAGVGVLYWRDQEIEWRHQPIITRNRPPSWGDRSYRYRPIFVCECGRGAFHLFLAGDRYVCRYCAGLEPSTHPTGKDLHAKVMRLRRKLGMLDAELLADCPKPKGGPRARWRFYRTFMQLRLAECALLGIEPGEWAQKKGG